MVDIASEGIFLIVALCINRRLFLVTAIRIIPDRKSVRITLADRAGVIFCAVYVSDY